MPLFVIAPAVWLGVTASKEARIEFMRRLTRGNHHNAWLAVAAGVTLISCMILLLNISHSHFGGGAVLFQLSADLFMLLALWIGYRRGGTRLH